MDIVRTNVRAILQRVWRASEVDNLRLCRVFSRVFNRLLWSHGQGLWNCFSNLGYVTLTVIYTHGKSRVSWQPTNKLVNSYTTDGELGWRSGESARLPPGSIPAQCQPSASPVPCVGWVSGLAPMVFLRVLQFSSLHNKQHFQIPIRMDRSPARKPCKANDKA